MNVNTIDPMWIWIAVGVLAVIVIAALFARSARRSRTNALREKFGSEYDHAVQQNRSRKRAEQELATRVQEVEKHTIRPLSAAEKERYRGDWQRVERHFIERPATAVVEADELVADIMRVQGYPMGDFEKHAAHLSVTHPRVVEHYRAGHRAMEGAPGSASTEDLRQAMLHYRALFEELAGTQTGDVATSVPGAAETSRTSDSAPETVREREHAVETDPKRDFR
jgi:hypothetical protein